MPYIEIAKEELDQMSSAELVAVAQQLKIQIHERLTRAQLQRNIEQVELDK